MSNEDLFALSVLAGHLKVTQRDVVVPRKPGDEDGFLIREDKSPNSMGASLCGLGAPPGGTDAEGILRGAGAGRIKLLWVFHHDLQGSALPAASVEAAFGGAEMVVFQGPSATRTSERAHLVLPSAAYAERDGTFTSFEGRVQRFRQAVPPLGEALPDWDILSRLLRALGGTGPMATAGRAEQGFAALAASVPAFEGLSYRSLGDRGTLVRR
jgi:predicted molibdopterin-dependent oxidoreductase YjgC